jgi:hypothetical protein
MPLEALVRGLAAGAAGTAAMNGVGVAAAYDAFEEIGG